jgi:CheY-like chemotaxis protein
MLAPAALPAMAPRLPLTSWTVLVVDDDADMRLYLGGCLRGLGVARVVEAADGQEALRLAPDADLVISDVFMPGLDGIALVRALKADARTRAIPVLLVSGEVVLSPLDARADGFLTKPFNATRLRAAVERLLDHPP